MNAKDLHFDSEGREKLLEGIRLLSKAVKSTLGPSGHTAMLESSNHTKGLTITKDGVTVAKNFNIEDPVANLAVNLMKEAAENTAITAGDGTTTAIVLTEAIIENGMRYMLENPKTNVHDLISHIKSDSDAAIKHLDKISKKVSGKTLESVATISTNNNKELGKIISNAYKELGKDGKLTVENSKNENTYCEITDGIKIDRGYSSKLFVNNHRNDECIMDDVYVLMTDMEISNILEIESVLKPIINDKKKLLIIGNCTNNVTNTLAANVVQNNLKLCNIIPPSFGYKTNELMSDIALATGAKYFSESQGDNLGMLTMADLGHADKIVIGKRESTIFVSNQETEEIKNRISELKDARDMNDNKNERDFIDQRISLLNGKVGVIYVGGDSDIEQKELYDRVEDAVCAVKSAIEEGILPGGGIALLQYADKMYGPMSDVLRESLIAPFNQILVNAGKDPVEILEKKSYEKNSGYDVKNDKYGDMYKMGIIDPAKVTKNALKNAVSVATTILSTNAIMTIKRK